MEKVSFIRKPSEYAWVEKHRHQPGAMPRDLMYEELAPGRYQTLDFIYPEDLIPQDAARSQPSPKPIPCTKMKESIPTSKLSQLTLETYPQNSSV